MENIIVMNQTFLVEGIQNNSIKQKSINYCFDNLKESDAGETENIFINNLKTKQQ